MIALEESALQTINRLGILKRRVFVLDVPLESKSRSKYTNSESMRDRGFSKEAPSKAKNHSIDKLISCIKNKNIEFSRMKKQYKAKKISQGLDTLESKNGVKIQNREEGPPSPKIETHGKKQKQLRSDIDSTPSIKKSNKISVLKTTCSQRSKQYTSEKKKMMSRISWLFTLRNMFDKLKSSNGIVRKIDFIDYFRLSPIVRIEVLPIARRFIG